MPGVDFDALRAAGVDTRNIKEIVVQGPPQKDEDGNEILGVTVKIKLPDRMAALVHCGRALMMFGDKRDVRLNADHRVATDDEVRDTLRSIVEGAREDRAKAAAEGRIPGVQT